MSDKTFAIKGIPPPADVQSKKKEIPYAPGMPVRVDISKLFPSDDPFIQKQWTLFILALDKFKAMSVDECLSYFQVAGIHGYPETSWDGADPPPQDPSNPDSLPVGANPFGGYCHHNSISFPTWHRPYMLLFEQLIWKNMNQILDSWGLDEPDTHQWKEAADLWRLPYWDWAREQTYGDASQENTSVKKCALPYALTLDRVPIYPPPGKDYDSPFPNPLWGFVNPEQDDNKKPRAFGDMPAGKTKWNIKDTKAKPPMPWGRCSGVSRYGIISNDGGKTCTGLDGNNEFAVANEWMDNFAKNWYNPSTSSPPGKFEPPGTLADAVNRLFSKEYSDTWGSFASTKWWLESAQNLTTGYLSLEYIHNNVHVISGGGDFDTGVGHMSDVPVAAFDPMFWLHHCNIDRLLSMWQVLNWKVWWNTPEPSNNGDNYPDPASSDPLQPFHKLETEDPKSGFWTSDQVRDWTELNYSYEDLIPTADAILPDGSLDEEIYRAELLAHIHEKYSSTQVYFERLFGDEEITNGDFFGPNNSEERTWNDYIINVIYDRYAIGGSSYKIEFWLGGAHNDPDSTFAFKENLVGQVYSLGGMLSGPMESSGCNNCSTQREAKVLSKAQVPLTIPIISQALNPGYEHLSTTRRHHVIPYLKKHLHWKFVQIGGKERPATDFPDTTIAVLRGTGKPQPRSRSGKNMPPKYGNYRLEYDATDGKEGGLTRGDELLGESHTAEFNFRRI